MKDKPLREVKTLTIQPSTHAAVRKSAATAEEPLNFHADNLLRAATGLKPAKRPRK